MPTSAWKDYSTASTNYAFDMYDSDEKQQMSSMSHRTNGSSRSTIPIRDKQHSSPRSAAVASYHATVASNGNSSGNNHYGDVKSLHRNNGGDRTTNGTSTAVNNPHQRSTYSLPRPPQQPPPQPPGHHNGGYYTHRPPPTSSSGRPQSGNASSGGDQMQPDFYFMPSQRKYSGEVVRVYVDYNTNPRK